MQGTVNGAGLRPVNNETRGEAIKRRRLALGIKSVRQFAERAGVDRQAVGRAERGETTTPGTLERLEAWLDRFEEDTGHHDVESGQIEVTFRNVFGIGEIIYKGAAEDFPEVQEYVERLMQQEREGRGDE